MKKTYSFSLENDIISVIDNYKKEKKLGSRSLALERIILEYKFKNLNADNNLEEIKKAIETLLSSNKVENKKNNEKENSILSKSINSIYANME